LEIIAADSLEKGANYSSSMRSSRTRALDGVAQLAHQRLVVVQVVQGVQARAEDLVRLLQVVQVGAREVPAGVAGAGFVERARVVAPARVADLDVAAARVEPAVARVARRQHAVEQVDPRRHRLDDVLGRAHAHQVARALGRQARRGVRQHALARFPGFADREAADGIAVEADARQALEAGVAQVRVDAALHDAEQGIPGTRECRLGALGPAQAELHRFLGLLVRRRVRRAIVEHHGDIGIERALHAHRFLGCQQQPIAVDGRGELHPVLTDLAQGAQAEHLEAA
jgi:hypothetical protein